MTDGSNMHGMMIISIAEQRAEITQRLADVKKVRLWIDGDPPSAPDDDVTYVPMPEPKIEYWIAGGFVRDAFAGEHRTNDVDLFFPNVEQADAMAARIVELGFEFKEKTGNADKYRGNKWPFKIDIVRLYDDGPAATIARFDFTVCSVAVDAKGNVYHHPGFFSDLAARALVLNDPNTPLGTLRRLFKYNAKGFHACDGTLIDLARRIQKVNFDDPAQNVIAFYADGRARIVRFD